MSDLTHVAHWGSGAYYDMPLSVGDGTYYYWPPNRGFGFPEGIITDGTYVWVADTGNNSITKHHCSDLSWIARYGKNYNGNAGRYFGFSGTGDGEFNSPWQMTSTRPGDMGDIIVSDYANYRFQTITKDGGFVNKIGSQGAGQDQFYVARGVASDGTYYYVYDSSNQRIKQHRISDMSYVSSYHNAVAGLAYIGSGVGIMAIDDALDPFPTKSRGYIIG